MTVTSGTFATTSVAPVAASRAITSRYIVAPEPHQDGGGVQGLGPLDLAQGNAPAETGQPENEIGEIGEANVGTRGQRAPHASPGHGQIHRLYQRIDPTGRLAPDRLDDQRRAGIQHQDVGNAGWGDERQRERRAGLLGHEARVAVGLLLPEEGAVLEPGGEGVADDHEPRAVRPPRPLRPGPGR
jgi:hypothetical protein